MRKRLISYPARTLLLFSACLALLLAACAPAPTAAPTAQPAATSAPAEQPTASQATEAPAAEATNPAAQSAAGQMVWALAGDGNEARYRVTEQLAQRDFPSDAVGATSSLTGQLALSQDGQVMPDASKFVVDLTTLKSDKNMRDRYLQRNTLQTSTYPDAEFVPTEVKGLPSPLPTSGEVTFQLVGDMTIHGDTQPLTWDVTAQVDGGDLTGTATTSFTFATFGLQIPSVMSVLSIKDNINLEYDFHLVQETS
jgi:polyisoprenoid-binding protein YceI